MSRSLVPELHRKGCRVGEQHSVLNLQLLPSCPLLGADHLPCEKQLECLSGISVDAVINAVKKQLQQNGINRCPLF